MKTIYEEDMPRSHSVSVETLHDSESSSPDHMPPKQVTLQEEVIHEGHEQQQRGKAASNEGHKVGQVCERWRRKLLQVLLCCFVTGV